MKHLNTKTQFAFSILPFALCLFLFLFSACDSGSGTSDKASSGTSDEASSDTGSIAFSLAWEEDESKKSEVFHAQAAQSPIGDVCVNYGIVTISAMVYNSSDKEVKSESWPCSDHEGTISDVLTGSGMYLIVEGTVAGNVDWQKKTTTFTVSAGQITDVGLVYLNYIGNDVTPPTAGSPSPPDGATDVAVNSVITATFSEAVDPDSVNASSFILMAGITTVNGSVSYDSSSRTATFIPDSNLAYSTAYTATITTDVKDPAGNQMEKDYTWSFTAATTWGFVAAGAYHTIAIKTDGSLWAWGNNGSGQLGDGSTANKRTTIQIGSETDWDSGVAGAYHTIAIKTDGSLWAWGDNCYGQLGDGSAWKESPVNLP